MGKERWIMGFAGHMIDHPSRATPRFPAKVELGVRAAVRSTLLKYEPEAVVTSAACGGDIIFAEEAIQLKIPLFIILPFEDRDKFIELSVAYAGDEWISRFYYVCQNALEIFYVNPGTYRGDSDFKENQHAVVFFALGFSRALKIKVANLILFDHTQPVNGPGGTKSYLDLCKDLNIYWELIDMEYIRNHHGV